MRKELQEKKELNRLEDAAEKAKAPEDIQQRAKRNGDGPAAKSSTLWFMPHLIAAAVIGGGILLLDWKPSLFR